MDQPGPRHQILRQPIIERPELQSPRQRTLYGVLTLGFWAFWIYLWIPLLALLAWVLGVQQAYKYMVVLGGYVDVLTVAASYLAVIVLLGGGLLLWAIYNITRYRVVDRRTDALRISAAEIGMHFGHDAGSVASWQSVRRLYVKHDEKGRIASVESLGDAAAPA
jgi:biofilm PGA synthesis protein PgaD